MNFELSIVIKRPPTAVFDFLRDKDKFQQPAGSPVLALEQTTPGPAAVGTRYREVVQMLPFIRGESGRSSPASNRMKRLRKTLRGLVLGDTSPTSSSPKMTERASFNAR